MPDEGRSTLFSRRLNNNNELLFCSCRVKRRVAAKERKGEERGGKERRGEERPGEGRGDWERAASSFFPWVRYGIDLPHKTTFSDVIRLQIPGDRIPHVDPGD